MFFLTLRSVTVLSCSIFLRGLSFSSLVDLIFLFFKEITGNKDWKTKEGRILNPPVIARYVRIHPKAWSGHIALRVELYGCKEGTFILLQYYSSSLS